MSSPSADPFKLLQERPSFAPLEPSERDRLCRFLDESNPLNAMPLEAFQGLLQVVHECAVVARGATPRTSTRIQFDVARRILSGELTDVTFSARFEHLWDWPELAKLEADPLFACCYMRLRTLLGAAPVRGQAPASGAAA